MTSQRPPGCLGAPLERLLRSSVARAPIVALLWPTLPQRPSAKPLTPAALQAAPDAEPPAPTAFETRASAAHPGAPAARTDMGRGCSFSQNHWHTPCVALAAEHSG